MIKLPAMYQWLEKEPGPKILTEALKLYGTLETAGPADNPVILGWATELGLKQYVHDSIAWCGLFVAICVKRAGKEVVKDPLWAANWAKWGQHCEPELGAIGVFDRPGAGNHVGIIVGEDATHYHVYGGNQKDSVCIARLTKDRLWECRALYQTKPTNIRRVTLSSTGEVSQNES